jgi:hypothetical protein
MYRNSKPVSVSDSMLAEEMTAEAQAGLLPAFFEAPPEDYVTAQHDFHPPASQSHANTYLAFRAGDRIRIHNRDPASGWWDGELMETSAGPVPEVQRRRGWLPSNHVVEESLMEDDVGINEGVPVVLPETDTDTFISIGFPQSR